MAAVVYGPPYGPIRAAFRQSRQSKECKSNCFRPEDRCFGEVRTSGPKHASQHCHAADAIDSVAHFLISRKTPFFYFGFRKQKEGKVDKSAEQHHGRDIVDRPRLSSPPRRLWQTGGSSPISTEPMSEPSPPTAFVTSGFSNGRIELR